jgi:hypothetical protein
MTSEIFPNKLELIRQHRAMYSSGINEAKTAVEHGWQPTLGEIFSNREKFDEQEQERKIQDPDWSQLPPITDLQQPKKSNPDQEYRYDMEMPMENLGIALYGYDGHPDGPLGDPELVVIAARKINMLSRLVLEGAKLTPGQLKIIMES